MFIQNKKNIKKINANGFIKFEHVRNFGPTARQDSRQTWVRGR